MVFWAKGLDGRPSKRPSSPSPVTTFCLRKDYKPVAAMSLLPGQHQGCETWNRTDDVLHYQQQQLHASCHRGDEVDRGIAKQTAEPMERSEMKLVSFPRSSRRNKKTTWCTSSSSSSSTHRDEADLGIARPTADTTDSERSEMKLQQAAFLCQLAVAPSGRLVMVSAAPDDCVQIPSEQLLLGRVPPPCQCARLYSARRTCPRGCAWIGIRWTEMLRWRIYLFN
ncbi:hypothetical protein HPB50_026114 [Hyalomma asiaticum]|uniref:Uncharacterized protein n=1 Tax=Hyalomma asiaticum TaxID=266040 RepID=A0ACB7TRJ0_HYAAI|nr:hypothetical protein HPB50_026114 [Hyalomma asiaticum]